MTRRLLFGVVLLAMSGAGVADATRDPGRYLFNDSFGDFAEEVRAARDAGKQAILIMFEMDE
jgi:hypothetical protein